MNNTISKRITSLRFILIILVVFIHNNSHSIDNTVMSEIIKIIFSETIARVAVPLFFLISGYLFFCKENSYSYVEIAKKKVKTLLVPFLFWNVLELGMFFVGQNIPGLSRFFTNENNMVSQYTFRELIASFICTDSGYPIAYQFWFIRDLIIIMAFYPIMKRIINRMPVFTMGIMTLFWLMDWHIGFVSSEAILFFYLGYYAIKYQISLSNLDAVKVVETGLLYIVIVLIRTALYVNQFDTQIIYKVSIVVGGLFLLQISMLLIKREKVYSILTVLSGYSFFVFAFHEPFLTLLRKVWDKIFVGMTTASQMIQYFGLIFLITAISLIGAWILRKISPKFYALITGGRM